MERYNKSLQETPAPISLTSFNSSVVDMHKLNEYAKSRNMHIADLNEEEKRMFIDISLLKKHDKVYA